MTERLWIDSFLRILTEAEKNRIKLWEPRYKANGELHKGWFDNLSAGAKESVLRALHRGSYDGN